MAGFNELQSLDSSDPRLSFRLAQEVPDLEFRQTLLTMRSEAERMRRIADFPAGISGTPQDESSTPKTSPAATAMGAGPRKLHKTLMSVLIFDADDTLWENNIYFERAFDDFVGLSGAFRADAAADPRRAQ